MLAPITRPLRQVAGSVAVPKRLTRTVTRPMPLRVVALAVGAAAILIARALHHPSNSARTTAAAAWSDVPSAPDWYVPNGVPINRYDELRATDIAKTLRRMEDPEEIQRVLDYEKEHNQRVTVFKAAKARLRALETASR